MRVCEGRWRAGRGGSAGAGRGGGGAFERDADGLRRGSWTRAGQAPPPPLPSPAPFTAVSPAAAAGVPRGRSLCRGLTRRAGGARGAALTAPGLPRGRGGGLGGDVGLSPLAPDLSVALPRCPSGVGFLGAMKGGASAAISSPSRPFLSVSLLQSLKIVPRKKSGL